MGHVVLIQQLVNLAKVRITLFWRRATLSYCHLNSQSMKKGQMTCSPTIRVQTLFFHSVRIIYFSLIQSNHQKTPLGSHFHLFFSFPLLRFNNKKDSFNPLRVLFTISDVGGCDCLARWFFTFFPFWQLIAFEETHLCYYPIDYEIITNNAFLCISIYFFYSIEQQRRNNMYLFHRLCCGCHVQFERTKDWMLSICFWTVRP